MLHPWTRSGDMLKHPSVIYTMTQIELKLLKQRKVSNGSSKSFIGDSIAEFEAKTSQQWCPANIGLDITSM
jgi:hypothetical protein